MQASESGRLPVPAMLRLQTGKLSHCFPPLAHQRTAHALGRMLAPPPDSAAFHFDVEPSDRPRAGAPRLVEFRDELGGPLTLISAVLP